MALVSSKEKNSYAKYDIAKMLSPGEQAPAKRQMHLASVNRGFKYPALEDSFHAKVDWTAASWAAKRGGERLSSIVRAIRIKDWAIKIVVAGGLQVCS